MASLVCGSTIVHYSSLHSDTMVGYLPPPPIAIVLLLLLYRFGLKDSDAAPEVRGVKLTSPVVR